MKVKEAISLLAYGTQYEIKGAFSGKIYHRTFINNPKNLDKYADQTVSDEPFYVTMMMRGHETNEWCFPVIGIWMSDYDLVKEREKQ